MRLILFCIACLTVLSLSAQKKTAEKLLPVNEQVKTGKLKNGLTYYIRKNTEPKNRAELRLVVHAGSILETGKQVGVAHFVEHMAFNGTKNFRKNELVDFLEKSGVHFGADVNAYTSFDETVYELQVPTDSPMVYKKGMQILEDWANAVSFEPEEIDKERGVIVEEWRLGRGADARLRDRYFPVLLKGSQYAIRLPIGTKANIDTVHYSMLTSFYKDWYRPDLQAVIVVGDVDVNETEKMIIGHFEHIPAVVHPKKRTRYRIPPHTDTRTAILTDPEQTYNVIQIYYTQPEIAPVKTETQYRAGIVRNLFNQMLSSRLDEIAQNPDAPFLFGNSGFGGFMGDRDAFTLLAVAKSGNQVERSILVLLTENERVRRYGFLQSELDRAMLTVMTRMENAYNERDKTKSAELVQELMAHYLEGTAIPGIEYEFDLYKKYLPGITLHEINSLIAQWIKKTDRSVVITAPEKEKRYLPGSAAVIAMLNKSIGNLSKYIDKVNNSPLLASAPIPGTITEEKRYASIGTTEWILSNGARVILKPTDFKNDEIEFSAISWGGTSLYSDADYLNAANAGMVAYYGGLGSMDIQSLQKMLSGKNCSVIPSVATYMQGINGRSSIKDLATAFELLHASFISPRKDPEMFKVILQNMKVNIENKDKDPISVFGDSVSYIMSNYHPRRKPMELVDTQRLSLDRSFEIYKERFSNAGQFLFTFVGNFNTDSVKPLIETYIASLPGTIHKENWKDIGMRYPTGRISKTIKKGKESKASVRLFFTGMTQSYTESDDRQLGQLCAAMAIRLRELMREDAGSVYGVSVHGGINREPVSNYSIGILFSCAPENVDKLIQLVTNEIQHVKQNGVPQVNIEKVIAEQTRDFENNLKENSYWRYRLEQQFFRKGDPETIPDGIKKIKDFSVEKSKSLANQFFNNENLIKFVLLPEYK